MKITATFHPDYLYWLSSWVKWRLCYEGGAAFIENYLKKYTREATSDFNFRKDITYVPAFAKAAVIEIRNSVFQRMPEIVRRDGPRSYQIAMRGEAGGVDKLGSSLTSYMGLKALSELLVMGKVGIWIDRAPLDGLTVADKKNNQPYLYEFWAEDIVSWVMDDSGSRNEFSSVLLREKSYVIDPETGFPFSRIERYRDARVKDGKVTVSYYDSVGNLQGEPVALPFNRIPFVLLTLPHSLMQDVADYQVALLNMASADVSYAVRSNFPFYVEQFDSRLSSQHLRKPDQSTTAGTSTNAQVSNPDEFRIGVNTGRRYPIGVEAPRFIHPSSEPLTASLEKQAAMKSEIRQLVQLAVTSLDPKLASAESKGHDDRGLEAGLAAIGLELERGERLIGEFWAEYEGELAPTVRYPTSYSLQSDADRRKEAEDLVKLMPSIPSFKFQKEVAKEAARKLLGHKLPIEIMEAIGIEIDQAQTMTSDPNVIAQDVEKGLVSAETASQIRGYASSEAAKAQVEHARRLALIAASQSKGARGINDLDALPSESADKEKELTQNPDLGGRTRRESK